MNIHYCRKCGAPLKIVRKNITGYRASDGKKIYKSYLVCVLRGNGWFDPHDRWEGETIEGEPDDEFHFDMNYYY